MKFDERVQRQEILLSRLKKQWTKPDDGLWEEYLHLIDKEVKEAQIAPDKFDLIGEITSEGVFDRRPNLISDDARCALENLLKTLTPMQQKVVRLTFWDGLSVRQIAKVLGQPRSTVNDWKYAAIKKLRQKSRTVY